LCDRIFIDTEQAKGVQFAWLPQRPLIKGVLSATCDTDVTGDAEKTRNRFVKAPDRSKRPPEEAMKIRLGVD
jgi:hypothetical protein